MSFKKVFSYSCHDFQKIFLELFFWVLLDFSFQARQHRIGLTIASSLAFPFVVLSLPRSFYCSQRQHCFSHQSNNLLERGSACASRKSLALEQEALMAG